MVERAWRGVVLRWDEQARVARMWTEPDAALDGPNARAVLAELDALAEGGRMDMLLDISNAAGATLVWQLEWFEFFRRHKRDVRAVLHGVPRNLDGIARRAASITGAPIHVERDEAMALARLARSSSTPSGPSPS